jgi:ABC-type branched-subunit amino acid transport system ATPase component/ABC-type branched-subunit amino acid transport system permease subunit
MGFVFQEAFLAAVCLNILFALSFYITYMTGQLSFGHAAFASVGAYVAGVLTTKIGINVWVAVSAACGAGLVAGFLVALPALRTRHVYLAILTFGVMQILSYALGQWEYVGGLSGITGLDGVYASHLAVAAAALITATWWLERSRLGLAMAAVKQDEVAAPLLGIDATRLRLLSFCLGSAAAAVAGALYGHYNFFVDPYTFGLAIAINMVFCTIVGGTQVWLGPVVGAIILTFIPEILREYAPGLDIWRLAVFGAILLLTLSFRPEGLVQRRTVAAMQRLFARAPLPTTVSTGLAAVRRAGARLRLLDVCKNFGGVTAVANVSLDIPAGSIFGLIGPNGAGKTTVFNLITGAYKPDTGDILLEDESIARRRAHVISRRGISRTFQNIRLFRQMTVYENLLTAQASAAPTGMLNITAASRSEEARLRRAADQLLEVLGISAVRDRIAIELPYATQRRVEIARALAQNPRLLLLDEPTAGMDAKESAEIREIIALVRRELGCTVLLIEHDMSVIMNVCERVAVLNFGRLIAVGTPAEVQANTDVHEAYLGKDSDA